MDDPARGGSRAASTGGEERSRAKHEPSRNPRDRARWRDRLSRCQTVVDGESFLLKVKKNSWYTIRIVKEGYFPQIVSIDTKLPEYNTDNHSFHFDTELIKEGTRIQDEESVEFPISIISYNKSIDTFSPVEEYSTNIQRSMFDVPPVKESLVRND